MTAIKFCTVDRCHEVAIGVSRWDSTQEPVSDYCRPHYLAQAETVWCEVVGPAPVTDCRTQQGVSKGGVVALDPLETNIVQLVYAGHVKVLDNDNAPDSDRGNATGGTQTTQTKPTAESGTAKKE